MNNKDNQLRQDKFWKLPSKKHRTLSGSFHNSPADEALPKRHQTTSSFSLWDFPGPVTSEKCSGSSFASVPSLRCSDVKCSSGLPADIHSLSNGDSDLDIGIELSYFATAKKREKGRGGNCSTLPDCPICMDTLVNPHALACSHQFCKDCLDQVVSTSKSHLCPTCRVPFRTPEGKQPPGGTMTTSTSTSSLPGHEGFGCITIHYNIPSGIQGPEHPNPGVAYNGDNRTAYLPHTNDGLKVERLLRKAFNHRLIFNIGTSLTSGRDNRVVWNDIHHKTSQFPGPYGYPDPDYLERVIGDLRARGITE